MFTPTRDAGLAHLAAFAPRAGRTYTAERNFDRGPGYRDNVSTMSPWIRYRLVREDEVIQRVLEHHRFEEAEKFIQEVVWRTYWKGWLEMRLLVWRRYCDAISVALGELDQKRDQRRRYGEATSGRTGIASFDDWAIELQQEGYLHNHARMWFASIWIHTLRLPWVLGADYFLRNLIDGDAASNTLSWRWVAGLQTRGKAYLARNDNIAHYSGGRYAGIGSLATAAVPNSDHPDPAPMTLPVASERLDGGQPYAVLVGEDDCDPLSLGLPLAKMTAVAGFSAPAARSPLPTGPLPIAFSRGAVADAVTRIAKARGCAATLLPNDAAADDVLAWVRQTGVKRIVTGHAPVGPGGDHLAALRIPLANAGIALISIRRPWDLKLWPYATEGFFPFWRRAKRLLRAG